MATLRCALCSLCLLVASIVPAGAASITGFSAQYWSGQTFLTWTAPAGSGWSYRVYRATSPPRAGDGPAHYTLVGTVGDSSWCDRRLSSLTGVTYPFVLPGGGVLGSGRGLFVYTCGVATNAWYAVTCRSASTPEDTTLTLGINAAVGPAAEWPDRPQPVRQRTVTVYYGTTGISGDVYTLWTHDQDTPFAAAMCNRPSIPYDCAVSVNAGGPTHALMFHAHVRGGNFLTLNYGSGAPGEYVITMDDHIGTSDENTFWFGFDEAYNIYGSNEAPTTGRVVDYTMRRMIHTLEWARREFPVDTTRVYVMGASMGGMAAAFLPLRRPDLIAASMANVPLFDFSFEGDPNTACAFGINGAQRETCDHLFGTVEAGLEGPDGTPVFDLLNCNKLVLAQAGRFVPPIVAFSGRYDSTIGWAEKPRYYATMRSQRAGGCFFFDTRTHGSSSTGEWSTLQDYRYLYRYRTDLSFPAFSNGSADSDPGDGHAISGDSVGTINGFMDWDPNLIDTNSIWSVRLMLRDLWGLHHLHAAPESLCVDVTPRRTQAFHPPPDYPVQYSVVRDSDGELLASGEVLADRDGIVTVPQVRVLRAGSRLTLARFAAAAVPRSGPGALALSGLRNPVLEACDFEMLWPRAGPASISLFDVTGRRIREWQADPAAPGAWRVHFDPRGLRSGVYLLRASQGGSTLMRHVVIAR